MSLSTVKLFISFQSHQWQFLVVRFVAVEEEEQLHMAGDVDHQKEMRGWIDVLLNSNKIT